MPKAGIIKELLVKTENRVGMLAELTEAISKSGVNVTAVSAFAVGREAIFRIVTSDNLKAIGGIKAKNFEALERDAVVVELENEVGKAADMADKLTKSNIDINYIYGTTSKAADPCTLIFNCSDNKKAVEVING